MPDSPLMTWNESSSRWFKKHEGQQHAVSCGKLRKLYPGIFKAATETGSWKAANAWWVDRLTSLKESDPIFRDYQIAIHSRKELVEAAQVAGDLVPAARWQTEIGEFQQAVEKGNMTPLDSFQVNPIRHISEAGRAVWSDRVRMAKVVGTGKKPPLSIAACAKLYMDGKKAILKTKPWKAGNLQNVNLALTRFVGWLETDSPAKIDGQIISSYHSYLAGLEMSDYTRRDHACYVKAFVRWLYETEITDKLPRNLDSLKFAVEDDSIVEPLTDDEVKTLLRNCDSKQKLWALLALQCGFTQKDISDLRQHEVDWEAGRIIRQRSKTGRRNRDKKKAASGKSIPTVNWKLWPETFKLLKEQRSSDPQHVLLSDEGTVLCRGSAKDTGKALVERNDVIGRNMRRLFVRLKITKQFTALRKTGVSKFDSHGEFARYSMHFLCQSPRSVLAKFYLTPAQEQFDKAVRWLGQEYGF